MKRLFFFACCSLLFQAGFSQEGVIKAQPIKIESKNPTDLKLIPEQKTNLSLNMPDLLGKQEDSNTKDSLEPKISMLPTKDLVQAGKDLKLNPKFGENSGQSQGKHFPNMYLGDIKNNGKFIGIVCRDHEYVDGDLVSISVNGEVVDPKLFLTGAFKGVNVDLKQGFNRIEFKALNEGSSSPNTAQINVYDDQGKLLYANQWNLSAGSVATFIVTKD
ncbi:hypothetical protein [Cellulophaga baltica]|uniref:Uncharacterized protein n=1 Tax=Cellulophaga baltica TaxID=76594 RepID=A0A1G7H0B7_9FLAO|nr:hypothetical protein [Cellulophaga baltica]AIY12242.1 hypothetical protein M667_02875 [Cellulophaga baltica NN016038]MBA6315315.1 hypothetical protein [Cellulophaga baltica]SDE93866.1 hypothetical protein SAMN04487992_105186 [Cellulophaga baltica]